MSAGNYNTRLQRMVCVRTKNATNGDLEESFTPGAYYWCAVEYTGSSVRDDWDGNQTAQDITVRVRNFPDLTALDRFQDADGREIVIESMYPGSDEWVCECYSRDGGT
jgi:head-tail adaptor